MKKVIEWIIVLLVLAGLFIALYYNKEVVKELYRDTLYPNKEYKVKDKNEYYRNYDFKFVQNTDTFVANNEKDIYNIIYSGLNRGYDTFEFKCSSKYETCLDDVEKIARDNILLSVINDYVHPFNTFKDIETTYNQFQIVQVEVTKVYDENQIKEINQKIDTLLPSLTNNYIEGNYKSQVNTITNIHNYIINTTKYDSDKSDYGHSNYDSEIAYGPLFEGYGLCGGYTDLMQLFLERLKIKSYKVTSEQHIWNGVELNNKWYHLDLTWDDPVTNTGEQLLLNNYLLIDTNKLLSQDTSQHTFYQDYYPELKQ